MIELKLKSRKSNTEEKSKLRLRTAETEIPRLRLRTDLPVERPKLKKRSPRDMRIENIKKKVAVYSYQGRAVVHFKFQPGAGNRKTCMIFEDDGVGYYCGRDIRSPGYVPQDFSYLTQEQIEILANQV